MKQFDLKQPDQARQLEEVSGGGDISLAALMKAQLFAYLANMVSSSIKATVARKPTFNTGLPKLG